MSENKFEYLPGLIKQTRLAHIQAEKRLLALDMLAKHSTVYYACWTTALTLATLYCDYVWLPYLSVAAAIVVALFTVYASSQNYGIRAERMKNSYLALQELWLEFDSSMLTEEGKYEFADEAGYRYISILKQTENHLPQDHKTSRTQIESLSDAVKCWTLRICIYGAPIVSIIMAMVISEQFS